MSRTRSEYLLARASDSLALAGSATPPPPTRLVQIADRDSLASTLLEAYRGTVDDEGEGDDEARAAIDEYFARIEWPHSVVIEEDGRMVAISFVVIVEGRYYIDPVATIASCKRRGLGQAAVLTSLRSLVSDGVQEVGAVITDGNTPSEQLFAGLGFVRVGPWA